MILSLSPNQKKQIVVLFLLACAVGYHFARPSLERLLGVNLPALTGGEERLVEKSNANGTADAGRNDSAGSSSKNKVDSNFKSEDGESTPFKLKDLGLSEYQSPEGLVYGMGPNREHRIDHVMEHAKDSPNRPVHGVFDGDRDAVLRLLDEVYSMIKQDDRKVKASQSADDPGRKEYTASMGRDIGYKGGANGRRDGYPKLDRVKLILEGNHVITAYPY